MSAPAAGDAREALAAAQATLAGAVTGGAVPAGFDAGRVGLVAAALAHKRRRSVARAWPGLAEALGAAFAERFAEYAGAHVLAGGPAEDGLAFARWLRGRGGLPEGAAAEVIARELRRPGVRVAWLAGARRLLVGVRIPWVGTRLVSIGLPRKGTRGAGRRV